MISRRAGLSAIAGLSCLSTVRTPKITRILTVYQTNAATLTPLSKEDKILIKSLQECEGYSAQQFITEFMNKGWTKNSINSRQASGQRQTQSPY